LDKFPLHLRICSECGLGQVADVVTPERIFRDYRYLSSMSTTFLQHASDFVSQRVLEGMFSLSDWVLEIASNDGYLLKNFLPYGINKSNSNGVDYPFINNAHYPFSSFTFRLIPEGTTYWYENTTTQNSPITDNCE
jgi:hypothetical protein